MALSNGSIRRLIISMASATAGNEVAGILNNSGWGLPAVIVATHVSTTTDFSALLKGDILVHVAATPGNAGFEKIVTNGTKPSAAVIGDLYLVVRQAAALTKRL